MIGTEKVSVLCERARKKERRRSGCNDEELMEGSQRLGSMGPLVRSRGRTLFPFYVGNNELLPRHSVPMRPLLSKDQGARYQDLIGQTRETDRAL